MDIEIMESTESCQVVLTGSFDAFATPLVGAELADLIEQGNLKLHVDLEGVEFIDSSALAELVRTMKRARQAGGDLVLCNPSQAVAEVLELTSLNTAFKVLQNRRS